MRLFKSSKLTALPHSNHRGAAQSRHIKTTTGQKTFDCTKKIKKKLKIKDVSALMDSAVEKKLNVT